MDHTFSLGATRHHHHSAGSSQQFRVSPVNFPGGSRNSSSSNASNASQQQLFNSVSSLFGSTAGVLPQNLFGRSGGSSSNYLNSAVAPNHFNFPLRSNTMNNRSVFGNGNSSGANSFNRGRGGNQNHGHNQNGIKNRQQHGQNSTGSSTNQNQTSKNQSSTNQNNEFNGINRNQQPQYRIFKRGDSIPGITSPVAVITGGTNSTGASNNKKSPSSSKIEKPNSQSEGSGANNETSSSDGKNTEFQDKENKSGSDAQDESSTSNKNQPNKTPVSVISDIARFHGLTVEYRLIGEKGPPHSPTFTVTLHLGPNEKYSGQGSSIKRAQHAAATEALDKTAYSRPAPRTQSKRPFAGGSGGKRPNWALLQLTTIAEDLKEPISIVQQPVTIVDPFRRVDPPSIVSVHVGERIFTGEGSNFNAAKNMAAMIALKAMMKIKQEMELKKLTETSGEENDVNMENKSPISVVHEMAMKRGLTVTFEVVREEGPPHNKVFTVLCSVGVEEHKAEGQGPTKQAAKKAASELMIEKMNEIPVPAPNYQMTSLKSMQRGLFRQKVQRKKTAATVVKDLEKQTVSPISRLIQIAHIRKYKEPEFNLVASSSTAVADEGSLLKTMSERERRIIRKKKPSFTMEVIVGPHCSRGTGPNKKAAKKAAAEAALIELGYGPSEPAKDESDSGAGVSGATEKSLSGNKHGKPVNVDSAKNGKLATTTNQNISLSSARQIVPGVLVLNNESKDHAGSSPTRSTATAQEIKKVNSMSSTSSASSFRDGTEKLAYLARLLDVPVSYSDFPKKNEFLSVVSLGTNPPQVAHGCGATLDEAQNTAALKILEELSDMGLDNVSKSNEGISSSMNDNQQ